MKKNIKALSFALAGMLMLAGCGSSDTTSGSKENRNNRLRKLIDLLNIKLKGYYNYYGVIGNYKMLEKMNLIVKRLLYKWMNRRSQRRSFNWKEFSKKLKERYPIQRPFTESLDKQMVMNI